MRDEEKFLVDASTRLLDRTLAFIPRVDGRAQILLGLNLGAILVVALNVPPGKVIDWISLPAALAVVMFAVSLRHLYLCSFPRLEGGHNSLIYFREISKLREIEFIENATAASPSAHIRDVLGQVWRNSQIATLKFDSLEQAMRWFACALPLWILGLVLFVVETNKLALK